MTPGTARAGARPPATLPRCRIRSVIPPALVLTVALSAAFNGVSVSNVAQYYAGSSFGNNQTSDASSNDVDAVSEARRCTPDQLSTIRRQLPPDDCLNFQHQPWKQRCSLTYATRCPDATWLEGHYAERHATAARSENATKDASFLGVFVGCNKGFDAVNALRMGSGDPAFDKSAWEDAMSDVYKRGRPSGKAKLERDVCNQATSDQFPLPNNNHVKNPATVHCVEPVPATARALQRAAWKLQYDKKGLVVTHAALAKEDGSVPFPRGADVGKENGGIGSARCDVPRNNCANVTAYGLDSYVRKFVPKGTSIDYLSVDVEGHDVDVLMGSDGTGAAALERARYLEFEYNWMGPWKDRSLNETIEILDRRFGFTCYWAGFDRTAWRITGCWLDHYDLRFWSNVACANRNAARDVAERMEATFLDTLAGGEGNVRDFEHRFQRKG